ncbi:MAG: V-type ATPase subunit [Planctomycetota bacterium]|nr:V-type ATPase subunit [Planctomycetota bacterium]
MNQKHPPLRYPLEVDLIYLQVRMRCRLSRRPTAEDFQRFASLRLEQIAHSLSEKGYEEETRALAISQQGSDFLRALVRQHIEAEIGRVARLCEMSTETAAWLQAYRWKYDLRLLRAALRARQHKAEIWDDCLTPFANLPFAFYQALARSSPRDPKASALTPFAETPFGATLGGSGLSVDEIEVALCHDFYAKIIGAMLAAVGEDTAAAHFLNAEAHFANLLTLLSGRRLAASPEQVAAQMIAFDFWAKPEAVRQLMAAPDAKALIETLGVIAAHRGWQRIFPADAIKSEEMLAHIFQRHLRRLAQKVIIGSEPSPVAVPAYVFCLECEALNLNLLAAAHDGGIGADEQRALLVA